MTPADRPKSNPLRDATPMPIASSRLARPRRRTRGHTLNTPRVATFAISCAGWVLIIGAPGARSFPQAIAAIVIGGGLILITISWRNR